MSAIANGIVERPTPEGRRREIDVTDEQFSTVRELAAFHGTDREVWLEHRPGRTLLVSQCSQ